MRAIIGKELRQFFSSLLGLLALVIFLGLTCLFLFVFPQTDILRFGYASMDAFFDVSPYIFMQLIPAITMRSLSDEFRNGTYDVLITRPISEQRILLGKFFAACVMLFLAILPTLCYPITLSILSEGDGLDKGVVLGAYAGLYLLGVSFIAAGIFASSLSANSAIAFLAAAFLCYGLYDGVAQLAALASLRGTLDFFVEWIGMDYHFQSIRKGVLDSRDVVYFFSITGLFLWLTLRQLKKRKSAH